MRKSLSCRDKGSSSSSPGKDSNIAFESETQNYKSTRPTPKFRQVSRRIQENRESESAFRKFTSGSARPISPLRCFTSEGTKLPRQEPTPNKIRESKLLEHCPIHCNQNQSQYQTASVGKQYTSGKIFKIANEREVCEEKKETPSTERVAHKSARKSVCRRHRRQSYQSSDSDNGKGSVVVLYRSQGKPTSSYSNSCKSNAGRPTTTVKSEKSASIEPPLRSKTAEGTVRPQTRRKSGLRQRSKDNVVVENQGPHRSRLPVKEEPRKIGRVAEERKGRRRHRGGGEGSQTHPHMETCFDPSFASSKPMAHPPNSEMLNLNHQRPGNDNDLGSLMQHLASRHSKATGDNNFSPNDLQRVFPFQTTPSGNLKIIPNQVLFESKKVSVLVAEPRHAKVNVKAEQQQQQQQQQQHAIHQLSPMAVTADRLQAQCKLPEVAAGECRPRTQPVRARQPPQQQSGREQLEPAPESTHRGPVISNLPLAFLGFTAEQPIDWQNITLPEKTDLYRELSKRIRTYKNADCIVRIGSDEFHCHLLVLQSYSTFFDDKNIKEIELTENNVTSRAFSIIYDWMISPTSESCHLLRRDNILEIFLAAQYLGIKELEEQCWAFVDNVELFSEDTAFLLYLEARKIGNTAVMELMVPRIMSFFLMLVGSKDFLELHVEELCLILKSNYISVNSEMEILMSAVRWLMHDWEGRKQYLLEVMKCVRFGLIAPWQLVDVKRNPENPEFMELMSYPEVQKMVDDGLAFVIIKYWYGNQSEDYYHWIDLLGLTEPTNRNWAGEDKNYVTYREFLMYLEEYQRKNLSEFKNKKFYQKPSPPSTPPKDDSAPQTTNTSLTRSMYHNQKISETSATSNSKPSKHTGDTSNSGLTPRMMMPPEVLSQYLNEIGRTKTKGVTDKPNNAVLATHRNSGEPFYSSKRKYDDKIEAGRNLPSKKYTEKKEKKQKDNYSKSGYEFLESQEGSTDESPISNKPNFKCTCENLKLVKSEGETATTIQATYRGCKIKRKYKKQQTRRGSAVMKHHSKKIVDLPSIPIGLSLHESLEPIGTVTWPSNQRDIDRGREDAALVHCKQTTESTQAEDKTTRVADQLKRISTDFTCQNTVDKRSDKNIISNHAPSNATDEKCMLSSSNTRDEIPSRNGNESESSRADSSDDLKNNDVNRQSLGESRTRKIRRKMSL